MPPEAYFDAFGDAADVCPHPCLVPLEDDPDLASPVTGLIASRPAIGKVPSEAGHVRASGADPAANRFEVIRPLRLSGQGTQQAENGFLPPRRAKIVLLGR